MVYERKYEKSSTYLLTAAVRAVAVAAEVWLRDKTVDRKYRRRYKRLACEAKMLCYSLEHPDERNDARLPKQVDDGKLLACFKLDTFER